MAKKEKEVPLTEEVISDADHAEKRVYELGFHIDGELPAEEAQSVYSRIRAKIASLGEIVAEGQPRKVQLAYTVSRVEQSVRRDFTASFFSWVAYETDGAGHESVLETARADKAIFRFLDLRTTKDEAKHSEEMQELMQKAALQSEGQGEEGDVSDAELDAALKEVGV